MKKLKLFLLGLGALGVLAVHGQTNLIAPPTTAEIVAGIPVVASNPTISGGLQQVYDAALGSTNFSLALGGGRGLKGNHNLVFVDYLYNFNANAGLLLGFDDIATGSKFTTDNIAFVKGGFNLQAEIAPFKNWGLSNFKVTPFGSLLMSSSGGDVGQIIVGGINEQIGLGKGWKFNLGAFYENRTGGNSATDGAYLCGHLAVSKGF